MSLRVFLLSAEWLCCTLLFTNRLLANPVDSTAVLEAVVAAHPEDGDAWVRLGYASLEASKIGLADKAFNKAAELGNSARAQNGLGLLYMAKGKNWVRNALPYFRKAIALDPGYAEAALNIARVYVKLGEAPAAEGAFKRAIAIDSTYAQTYLEFIDWYADRDYYTYRKEMEALCRRLITLTPDDPRGYYRLCLLYAERKLYAPLWEIAHTQFVRTSDARWLPFEAQVLNARGDFDHALRLFNEFLGTLSDSERAYYEDLSLVASPAELKAFRAMPDSQRAAFLNRFWASRKDALLLGGAARRVEHDRRVWYARTFFGKVTPWDKRGEIYIRYGEPDYRSRSGYPNAPPPPAVMAFKERKAEELFNQSATYRGDEPSRMLLPMMMPGSPYYPGGNYDGEDLPIVQGSNGGKLIPISLALRMDQMDRMQAVQNGKLFQVDLSTVPSNWLWEVMTPSGNVRLNVPPGIESGIEPVAPIERGPEGSPLVPWESWVYLGIGNGVEFVFTDRYMHGRWDFPTTPTQLWNAKLVSLVNDASPAVEAMQLASEMPEHFDVPPGTDFLSFYYDTASFRGADNQSHLEVYFGIPPEEVSLQREGDRVQLAIERSLVLANARSDSIYRTETGLVYRDEVKSSDMSGLFVEQASLTVPPGHYELGVKLADHVSGKWGMYRQEIIVPDFADSLAISNVEMAWTVSDTPGVKKFKKGDVWVVPAPTRSYFADHDAYLYYEVYNLKRDAYGQARYRVTYAIRQNVRQSKSVIGVVLGGVRGLFAPSDKPEVSLSYERVSPTANEPVYFELDTSQLSPGLKQVAVEVKDLNSGRTAHRLAIFQVIEPPKPKNPSDAAFNSVMNALTKQKAQSSSPGQSRQKP